MTTFDNRERGFENKFALDQEQEFKAGARRNRMLGQWAAGLMGLEGAHVDEYAKAVVKSDFELPGDEAIMRREGDRLVLEPIRKRGLLGLLASMEPFDEEFPKIEDRPPGPENIF